MPTTEKIAPAKHTATTEQADTHMPTRDESVQQKLDQAEALLDEIDEVLDAETIEYTLTLSDLMRKGAMLHPQTFGTIRDCKDRTCALGAVEDGAKALGLL